MPQAEVLEEPVDPVVPVHGVGEDRMQCELAEAPREDGTERFPRDSLPLALRGKRYSYLGRMRLVSDHAHGTVAEEHATRAIEDRKLEPVIGSTGLARLVRHQLLAIGDRVRRFPALIAGHFWVAALRHEGGDVGRVQRTQHQARGVELQHIQMRGQSNARTVR